MPVFDSLLSKLQQVNLSDVNHELGKAKETLVYESGSYIDNFKSDAAHVGKLIRSESTKFSSLFGSRIKSSLPKSSSLSKSTSLPVISSLPGLSSSTFLQSSSTFLQSSSADLDCDPCRERAKVLESKYKYRSTYCGEEPLVSPTDLLDQESVVNRFIRVVGTEESGKEAELSRHRVGTDRGATPPNSRKLSSREDIRRKLASFGEEDEISEGKTKDDITEGKTSSKKGGNNNLQICFINETASDEEDVCLNPLAEETESESSEEEEEDPSLFMQKSDWEAFRNPDLSKPVIEADEDRVGGDEARSQRMKAREIRRRRKIQSAARLALGQCKQVARRQMILERQRRSALNPLRKLLGVDNSEITEELLKSFNIATLQVIVNDFREKIECYNNELVQMLLEKDELQNEQDSMLIDIEDVSQNK